MPEPVLGESITDIDGSEAGEVEVDLTGVVSRTGGSHQWQGSVEIETRLTDRLGLEIEIGYSGAFTSNLPERKLDLRHDDLIPIAEPLVPFLRNAIATSTSEFVFPDETGRMRTKECRAHEVLRSTLAKANLVDGWEHVCRRCKANGKPYSVRWPDLAERRCPNCRMKLWPNPIRKMKSAFASAHDRDTPQARRRRHSYHPAHSPPRRHQADR